MVRISIAASLLAFAASALALSTERDAPTTLCGATQTIAAEDEAAVQRQISNMRSQRSAGSTALRAGTVPVAVHIITCNGRGDISDSRIQQQIGILNSDMGNTGYSFSLSSIDRTANCDWFNGVNQGTTQERQMKSALRRGGASTLNFYTVEFTGGLVGYATFPSSYRSNPTNDGVVNHFESVVGGSLSPYNLGTILTHEVGHWVGLYHVFQGGCSGSGDLVSDTPPQSTISRGCPVGQDSCSGGGVDSVRNHMDYSQDSCRNQLTAGQIERLQAQMSLYRGI